MPYRKNRPTVGGFQELAAHTASGVLVQRPTVDDGARDALLKADTVELVRPFHGAVIHGDMAGDLGAVYPDTPRPDLTAVTTAAVLRATGRRVIVQDLNATQRPYQPAGAQVRLVKVQLPSWQADLEFVRVLAAEDPYAPVAIYGATVEHLPDSPYWPAIRGDAPTAVASLFSIDEIAIGNAYELFPLSRYQMTHGAIRVHLQASRGCNRTCLYCPYIRTLGRWSGRDPASLETDVRKLVELGVREVQFRDQDFASDNHHAIEVASVLERAGRGALSWSVEGNLDRFTPRLLAAMHDGGASEVIVGIESADPAVLRRARRRVLANLTELIMMVRRAGLRVRGLFIIGLPDDSWEKLLATLAMAIELDLDAAQFNAYAPLPGEKFGNSESATVHDFVPLTNDFRYRTCDNMSQKEIRLARAWATAAFRAHRIGDRIVRNSFMDKIRLRVAGKTHEPL
ncbi:MAG: radical SAM protein [Pseudonocardiales bacterium]|nr:radical SAM protein [Pseudonocardiales bacterium]